MRNSTTLYSSELSFESQIYRFFLESVNCSVLMSQKVNNILPNYACIKWVILLWIKLSQLLFKPPFRFTAIFITGNISINSSVAAHGVQLRWCNKFVFGNGSFVFRTIAIPRSWLAVSTLVWIQCSCPALWLVSFAQVTPVSVAAL